MAKICRSQWCQNFNKELIDDQIRKQAERAGLSQEEKDKLFAETREKVLARDPGNIPTPG